MTTMRGHHEGSLFLRQRDKRWVASVTMPDGRRRSRSARSKAEGVAALRELLRQRDQAIPRDPGRERLGPYLQRWLEDVRPRLAPATWKKHESIVRVHLEPALGHVRLSELSVVHVRQWLSRPSGADGQTRRHHRATLRRALADALRDGLIVRNVAALAEPPKMQKAERTYLTTAQVRRIIEEARDERLWPLWVVIVTTGLRVSEALGLAWSDVGPDTVTVRKQLARVDGEWVRTEPKTRRSRRTIPLTPSAIEALAEQRRRQDAERGDHPRPIDGLVFTTPTGSPIHATNILPEWYAVLRRLGLPRVTTHDLRHSAASMMLSAGVPLPVIADILGHSTVRVTADLYAHVGVELRRDAADRLAEALTG
jgi:integrase